MKLSGTGNEFVQFQFYLVLGSDDISIEIRWKNDDISLVTLACQLWHVPLKQGLFRLWQVPHPLVQAEKVDDISRGG